MKSRRKTQLVFLPAARHQFARLHLVHLHLHHPANHHHRHRHYHPARWYHQPYKHHNTLFKIIFSFKTGVSIISLGAKNQSCHRAPGCLQIVRITEQKRLVGRWQVGGGGVEEIDRLLLLLLLLLLVSLNFLLRCSGSPFPDSSALASSEHSHSNASKSFLEFRGVWCIFFEKREKISSREVDTWTGEEWGALCLGSEPTHPTHNIPIKQIPTLLKVVHPKNSGHPNDRTMRWLSQQIIRRNNN